MGVWIETFSRKRFGRRRQYYARIMTRPAPNLPVRQLWRTSEGYNNAGDRDAALCALSGAGMDIMVVELP